MPHEAPAQLAIQSTHSGSCSAPKTSVPPGSGSPSASPSVVSVVSPPPASSSSSPHAAAISDNAMSNAKSLDSARRSRTCVLLCLGSRRHHPASKELLETQRQDHRRE